MTVTVLTAVGDPASESALVALLSRPGTPVEVVRRCVDLPDLLSAAAAGLARAAVVSADLRRLDREALTRLAASGVAVVGLTARADEPAEQRLRQLGVAHIVDVDVAPEHVAAAVVAAVGSAPAVPRFALADPRTSLPRPRLLEDEPTEPETPGTSEPGRVVAVWGPSGAPGRTTVAIGLAAELAEIGVPALLVDADGYGGSVAQLLGLLDEAPGLAAACRLANNGTLDEAALAELALEARPGLRVLTGITRADRWPELRPSGLEVVLGLCRGLAPVTVVDCGFCLERDEELSFDTAAPRRNGATLATLGAADTVVAVAAADPVGLQRFVRGVAELADAVPAAAPVTVVNRVRAAVLGGGDARAAIAAALDRYAGVRDAVFVPLDQASFDAAVAAGRTLPEAAPASAARGPLRALAEQVAGRPAPLPRRRLLRYLGR